MRHDIGVQWPDKSSEMKHVDFVVYGDADKYSAMAATVGYPTAIAAKMVLEGCHFFITFYLAHAHGNKAV